MRSCLTQVRGPAQDSICIQEKALSGITIRWAEHPSAEKSSPRDDFLLRNTSLCSEKLFQGCFPSAKCIPLQEKALPGMLSFREMHPSAVKSSPRDDSFCKKYPCQLASQASSAKSTLASLLYWSSPSFSTFMKASFGISTLPTICIRFFPSFCFSRSFFFLEMSPP